jgi:hypothetical protein
VNLEFEDRFRYLTEWPAGDHTLILALSVWIGDSQEQTAMLLDTACNLCVMSATTAAEVGWVSSTRLERRQIDTRLGLFTGIIDRIDITFRGFDNRDLVVDCTWLIIEEWPGPTVMGWNGCLERMRWAVDPMDNWFYFAAA